MKCFDFIKLAITDSDDSTLQLDDADWQSVFDYCKRQALVGIGFSAVEKLHARGIECPPALRMQWLSLAMFIEQRNKRMNAACEKVSAMFNADGFRCCVLKGQGNLLNYPDSLAYRRQSGDIDLWVLPQCMTNAVRTTISYVYEHSGSHTGAIYHHIEMPVPGDVELEVHYRPGYLRSFLRNRRMQRWFLDNAADCMDNRSPLGFSVPTLSVNVVYQMSHLFSHVFEEGIGLRQLLDYYFTLQTWYNSQNDEHVATVMSREEIMHVLRSFGMSKFAGAVMWVLQRVFGMPADWLLCPPDERRGRQLLEEIIAGGNFGHYDSRDVALKRGGTVKHGFWKLKRIMRLVRNYPEEALWEPVFRVYHLFWRLLH